MQFGVVIRLNTLKMTKFILFLFFLMIATSGAFCQDAKGMPVVERFVVPLSAVVNQHKAVLNLTLIIDSVQRGTKIFKTSWKRELTIRNETEYLNVTNDIYLKIFLVRNEEYGNKFYSWKWDLHRKDGSNFFLLADGGYEIVDVGTDYFSPGNSYSRSSEGEKPEDTLAIYCRYKFD